MVVAITPHHFEEDWRLSYASEVFHPIFFTSQKENSEAGDAGQQPGV
jgi:hypothetical protein